MTTETKRIPPSLALGGNTMGYILGLAVHIPNPMILRKRWEEYFMREELDELTHITPIEDESDG